MQNFEGQCHVLTDQLEEAMQAYNRMKDEKSALEMALKDPAVFLAHQRNLHQPQDEGAQSSKHDQLPVRPIAQPSSHWVILYLFKAGSVMMKLGFITCLALPGWIPDHISL